MLKFYEDAIIILMSVVFRSRSFSAVLAELFSFATHQVFFELQFQQANSLGHPCKFQLVLHLGSVTDPHSSSGRQLNFAALNRGRHLYTAGWP